MKPLFGNPRPRFKRSKEGTTSCPICGNHRLEKILKFEVSYENLCERCSFLKDVVEQSVRARLLIPSGNEQETSWDENVVVKDGRWSLSGTGNRWSNLTWKIFLGSGVGHTWSRFELFALPGEFWVSSSAQSIHDEDKMSNFRVGLPKPFSDFPVKKLPGTTASHDSFKKVQEWLDICQKSHEWCQPRIIGLSRLPKRVLDVSLSQVRLYETQHKPGRYVCLSHCWGDTLPACRTTSVTFEANQRGIDWEAIPATFRDSIDFTRRLGLQYIWIDSMCIIQDDPQDWGEQSALMANIYENAHVTLCATASSSDDGGCYLATPFRWQPRKLSIRKRDGIEYEVYIRYGLDKLHIPDWATANIESNPRLFPLMTRGWIYQERLLSRRLVHFAAGELMWECSELTDCECSRGERGESSPFMHSLREKKDHRKALYSSSSDVVEMYWNKIIYAYSGLKLKVANDKLPALSGVAKQMLSFRPGDEYLAGLWRKTIVTNLRWTVLSDSRRPPIWRSPSWSWAAIDGEVGEARYDIDWKRVRDYARCVDVSITPTGPDPTGELSSGYIILDAPVMLAQLENNPNTVESWDPWFLGAAGLNVSFSPDCKLDFEDGSLAIGDSLLCLRLGNADKGNDFCLVLKQRGVYGTGPIYERVGHFCHNMDELEKYWFTLGMDNMLVKIL